MSATSHAGHTHDALSHGGRDDPTKTTTLRKRYAQRLRGALGEINAAARTGIVERDVFNLRTESLADPPQPFRFSTDDKKAEAFMRWLRREERQGYLSIVGRNDNQFIRSAYQRGLEQADQHLVAAGVSTGESSVGAVFNLPVHREAVQLLYTRNYQQLRGITDAMNQQISRELAEGFTRGENPTKIARRISDRVDKIGKTRSTVLARTEVINAHSTSTLNRYEQAGVGEVTIKAEFSTAGDRRVCPLCASLEGKTFTIKEARTETFSYSADEDEPPSLSGEYPVNPPIHPQCRCAWIPSVTS